MDTIRGEACGKINLSLDVTGRREDGYHLVRMIMQTVGIFDTVTIQKSKEDGIWVETDSVLIPVGSENLAWKAADIMRSRFCLKDGLLIHIEKRIPVAAGMAGGSADAACVFRLIRTLYNLSVSDEELCSLALTLGADIPYCIMGGTCLCEGIGEILTKLPSPPKAQVLVVKPDHDVSTGWVYKAFDCIPKEDVRHPDVDGMAKALQRGDLRGMCSCMGNVLEQKTGAQYPVIGELKQFFLSNGALGSIMTGSGPTVFAIYDDKEKADRAFAKLKDRPEYHSFMKFSTMFAKAAAEK